MGKSDRLHRQLVIEGKEKPFRQSEQAETMMFCESCRIPVLKSQIPVHLKEVYHRGRGARFSKMEAANVKALPRPVG